MAQGDLPQFKWDSGFTKTLDIGYPLDNALAHSNPKPGSEFADSISGEADSWILGLDQLLEADIRWIPASNTTSPVATGWNTASTGFRLFLEYAREKQDIRFIPDRDTPGTFIDSILVRPMIGGIRLEKDVTRRIRIMIRSKDGSPYVGF